MNNWAAEEANLLSQPYMEKREEYQAQTKATEIQIPISRDPFSQRIEKINLIRRGFLYLYVYFSQTLEDALETVFSVWFLKRINKRKALGEREFGDFKIKSGFSQVFARFNKIGIPSTLFTHCSH